MTEWLRRSIDLPLEGQFFRWEQRQHIYHTQFSAVGNYFFMGFILPKGL